MASELHQRRIHTDDTARLLDPVNHKDQQQETLSIGKISHYISGLSQMAWLGVYHDVKEDATRIGQERGWSVLSIFNLTSCCSRRHPDAQI